MSSAVSPARLRLAELRGPERLWLLDQRYDRSVGAHEGPRAWKDLVDPPAGADGYPAPEPEFVAFDGRVVLLPVGRDHHPNLTRLRAVPSDDGRCVTLFLTDTTEGDDVHAGRLAFCEQAPDAGWFLCTVWHEWHPAR